MALNYTVYQYDGSRNAVVMTDMDGKELVIDCDRAEAQVVFDEREDAGILARLARKEPASYMSFAIERLISVVEYMEAHLLEKIDYEKFAEIANCPALLTLVSYL